MNSKVQCVVCGVYLQTNGREAVNVTHDIEFSHRFWKLTEWGKDIGTKTVCTHKTHTHTHTHTHIHTHTHTHTHTCAKVH